MESRRTVILPDMFKGFVVETPPMNPNYETVKPISEQWLAEKCSFSPRMKKRVEFCDFAIFISIAAPDAPFDKLKTMCDWGNWVFPFDDMFDEGSLKSDPKRSQVVIDSLMADMLDKTYTSPKSAVVQAHDDIFRRVSEASTVGKFRQVNLDVDFTNSFSIPSIQEMLDTRRLSSGVTPLYHLIEYAHDIKLPDEVFENPIVQKLELLGADFVLLSNDILSYRKEENDDCPFSMVAACRMTGQSPQEAFDTVGNLLEERYQDWQSAIEQLPSWGPEIDANVARYIQGIQNVVQANITWRYEIPTRPPIKCLHATASDRGDILGNKLPKFDGRE
ncbi:presilphiperfolan-8-beta-ol synthase [Fusarium subglutinans]|uniref:Terpene synthase n=1 Tax=Gibberella subglutinans TaxID=42677 RepID=A0A8H5Q207_GIBSU|nr:presilphiperfolan-8-beta-ol synthase [Fusarium subglutinans]KAF5606173.1 presilphiperfolan-8-beta-ol synthase [Fusarium subglutinans]